MRAATESTRWPTWSGLEDLRPTLRLYLTRRCRDESEIDDVVQETLLRAARYRDGLMQEGRLRPWVLRIATNVLRDYVRRENRLPRSDASDEVFERIEGRELAPGESLDEVQLSVDGAVIEKHDALRQLQRAMSQLRSEDRAVLGTYYAGIESCGETARVCAIAPGLVKVRLFRARKRLLRVLRSRLGAASAIGPRDEVHRAPRCNHR